MRWRMPAPTSLAPTFLAPAFLSLTFLLAACANPDVTPDTAQPPPRFEVADTNGFGAVLRAVQPVAAEECRRRTRGVNCNFLIVIDPDRRAEANAFQSVDRQGRPVLTVTAALFAKVRNPDELAFIVSHEASHHIANHLTRRAENAAAGAAVFADLATLTGGTAADIEQAQRLGAAVGARSYSKAFEIEADELGTLITYRAGYNPLIGAAFFSTIPDPGNQFLGTHPPNAERYDAVRRVVAHLQSPG